MALKYNYPLASFWYNMTWLSLSLLSACVQQMDIERRNTCYDRELTRLRETALYMEIQKAFQDTLLTDSLVRRSLLQMRPDEAVFLNKANDNCVVLLLQRSDDPDLGFGSARVFTGELVGGRWKFERSIWISFPAEFSQDYDNNSFENIAKLGRHSILTHGNVSLRGCKIDEDYWFRTLKE